jgi:hypothetical protein
MLGHLSFGVDDLERASAFYDKILAPLGYVRLWTTARRAVGFGERAGRTGLLSSRSRTR